ncbi:protein FAR1-RELATED SEQUENCE 5-like isoform X2 [Nymphaea colorata]|uniref:protein FAR1-RELATED SEQUENCE 5-like isoform X2 n=1 Tax=Nymphaea colorata TaxID=210225 RepID=UPI00214E0F1E|nr:protein FAR1-RELATED SEQUENCE 5-like isoform X2 [Nymphaea colorata]
MKRKTNDGKKERVTTRCGCPAKVNLSWKKEKKVWVISSVYLQHNHELHSPSKFKILKGAHQFNEKHELFVNKCISSGLKPYQVVDVLSHEADDLHNAPFMDEQLDVHFKRMVRSYYGKDCQYVVGHFKKKKEENPDFYYAIQFDSMGQFSNCFWVDARAREDYYYFGGVVLFDTSYKTNNYMTPFVPFIGVNHHCQSIVFGCALLIDESEASLMWVFSEWLQAMGGKYPAAIISDQDLAMNSAIERVLPHTIQKYYIWHIYQNVTDYISELYKNLEFRDLWEKWLYQSEKIQEFKTLWGELVTLFPSLKESEWVVKFWNTCTEWAKPYMPSTFMA